MAADGSPYGPAVLSEQFQAITDIFKGDHPTRIAVMSGNLD
jgi:hypothetical protein